MFFSAAGWEYVDMLPGKTQYKLWQYGCNSIVPEVDKQTLSSLWAQVANLIPFGSDRGLKHEVEGEGGRDFIFSVWRLDLIFCQGIAKLLG